MADLDKIKKRYKIAIFDILWASQLFKLLWYTQKKKIFKVAKIFNQIMDKI